MKQALPAAQVVVNSAIRCCAKGGAWAAALLLLQVTQPDVISAAPRAQTFASLGPILSAFNHVFCLFSHFEPAFRLSSPAFSLLLASF